MYVPILKMLQTLLSHGEILQKALSSETNPSQCYKSYRNGSRHFLIEEAFRVALCLYIDDFEVANPLGFYRNKHKVCAIYWVLSNLQSKYRSSLHSTQLALLCKVSNVKKTMAIVKFFALLFRTLFVYSNRVCVLNSWGPV